MIEVTVVTPTIPGREHFLAEARASVEAQTLPPVAHLVELDVNHVGPGPTLNKLVPQVETEWVSILADDDLYDPGHLRIFDLYAKDADIVISWGRFLGDDRPQYRGAFDIELMRAGQDSGMRGCFMFRKALYDQLGGWPETLGEDRQFLLNAHDAGARFAPVYRETWTYRQHDGSTSAAVRKFQNGELPEHWLHLVRHVFA